MILKQNKRTPVIIGLLIAFGIIGVVTGIHLSTNAQTDENRPKIDLGLQKSTAPRRVIQLEEPEWRQDIPLRAKIAQSRIVAIGEPISNKCNSSQDGNHVTTDYQIRIQEVLKGNVQPDSVIAVSMPGGLVMEPDGSLSDVRARFVRKMESGKTYLMFLKNAPANGISTFATLRGSQGLYEIPQNGIRVVHLGRSFELAPADDGELVSTFLQQVRAHVRER